MSGYTGQVKPFETNPMCHNITDSSMKMQDGFVNKESSPKIPLQNRVANGIKVNNNS